MPGQLVCAWTLWRERQSQPWREASAAFTALAFAVALALVGQIYHFPGDLDRFLLSCVLVALPLVYALGSMPAASLCALGLAGWAWAVPGQGLSVFAVTVAAGVGSFPDIGRGWFWTLRPEQLPQVWAFFALGMALLAVLAWRAWRSRARAALSWTLPALLMALVAVTDSRPLAAALALLLSAWLLLAGIVLIRGGLRAQDGARATASRRRSPGSTTASCLCAAIRPLRSREALAPEAERRYRGANRAIDDGAEPRRPAWVQLRVRDG